MLFRRKPQTDVFAFLFPLTAFGGALFFLIWETNGRYILPYAIFMFPYAGYGAARLAEQFQNHFIPFLKKRLKIEQGKSSSPARRAVRTPL